MTTRRKAPRHARFPGLNERQTAFVREYLTDFNGTKAALRAGYKGPNVAVHACYLLKVPKIMAIVKRVQEEAWLDTTMGLVEAKAVVSEIARARVADFIDRTSGEIRVHDIPNNRAVESLTVTETTIGEDSTRRVTKLKLHSPTAAIERLARLSGWEKPAGEEIVDVFTKLAEVIAAKGRDIPGAKGKAGKDGGQHA
jgi:phage terminase small subunit